MAFKTILVHVDESASAAARIQLAAQLALQEEAHLIGVASTLASRFAYQMDYEYCLPVMPEEAETLAARAGQALRDFERIAAGEGVTSYETRLADGGPEDALLLHSRYADLVVVSQAASPDAVPPPFARLPEDVMLHAVRPVLIVPRDGRFGSMGRRPLVAWDGGMEATRALTLALPLLRRAEKAVVAVVNPARGGAHGEQPGADIALYLARHGVKAEVREEWCAGGVDEALLSLAGETGSDLLVMGGYGHARLREMILGGTTRAVLDTMNLPVLMAH